MKKRIERLTREIEARNAACKQYAYDIAGNRQGARATGEDRQFDDADGCSLWRSFHHG